MGRGEDGTVAIGKEVCMGRGEGGSYREGGVYGERRRW